MNLVSMNIPIPNGELHSTYPNIQLTPSFPPLTHCKIKGVEKLLFLFSLVAK